MKTVETHPIQDSQALLVGWLHPYYEEMAHRKKRPCAVICPGGAYKYCSDREADPIAEAYFAKGFQVFILYYSTTGRELERPATGLRPLGELSESVVHIRENSALYGVDPEKIAVIGFSAGAHLAGSLGVHWNSEKLREFYPSEPGKNRPDAMVLSYPVISARPEAHPEWHDSFSALLGPDCTPEEEAFFSLEEQVNEETVPAFCWHTMDDDCVCVANTMRFVKSLYEHGIPAECHLFEHGHHGLSMCTEEVGDDYPHVAHWFEMSCEWLNTRFHWNP